MDRASLALLAILVPVLIYFRMRRWKAFQRRKDVLTVPETVLSYPAEKPHLSEQETKSKFVGGETYQQGDAGKNGPIQSNVDADPAESLVAVQIMTAIVQHQEGDHTPREDEISSGIAVLPDEERGQQAISGSENVEERRGVPPVKIPPRRRSEESKPQSYQARAPRSPKPELICLNRERKWVLAVEIPESLLENARLIVSQDGASLTLPELGENRCVLTRMSKEVAVGWNDAGIAKESKIPLGEEVALLFRLGGQALQRGRRVKSPSSGSYLVIAPSAWKRDIQISGLPPAGPEFVSLPGQTAHFFELYGEGGGRIAFRTPSGELIALDAVMPQFELVGTCLNEASENLGPVFSGRLPRIRAFDKQFWNEVVTIVVGREGNEGRTRNIQFNPDTKELEQTLPSEMGMWDDGWYFVRFHDANDDLIESQDFRFIRDVQEISILQPPFFPPRGGHESVRIECTHASGYTVRPADDTGTDVLVERNENKTVLNIPPDVSCDRTRWLLGLEKGPFVGVSFLVERCWWALGRENEMPTKWTDETLVLSASDFRATSKKVLRLRFPKRRWMREVLVGFEQRRGKQYPVRVTENTVVIPLCDFEIVDPERDCSLKVWVQREADRIEETTLGLIDHAPTLPGHSSKPIPFKDYAEDSAWVRLHLPRLATMVTHLKRVTRGPLRILIKEIRKECPGSRVKRLRSSKEFIRKALCLIVMISEGKEDSQLPRSLKRWLPIARAVRTNYSETMRSIQNRYEELLRNNRSAP